MSEVPVQLVVAAFQSEGEADEVLNELKVAKWQGLIGIKDAAVIRRDKNNKLHIKETGDMGGGKGAAIGGVVGAVIGVLTGPGIVATTAAGAAIGGLAAKLRDGGFPDNRLKEVGDALKPGTSAIVAVVEHKWVAELEKQMAEEGAKVLTESIKADIAVQLEEGRDVAYSIVEDQGGVVASRVAAGEDEVQVGRLVATDEGVSAARAVVTEEGVAGERLTVTDEAATYEVGAVTDDAVAYAAAVVTDEGVAARAITAQLEGEEEAPSEEEEKKEE